MPNPMTRAEREAEVERLRAERDALIAEIGEDDFESALSWLQWDTRESVRVAALIKHAEGMPDNSWPSVRDRGWFRAFEQEVANLRAEREALARALERLVLAGRYINIAPPRDDDANRQSDHDEFYAANRAGEEVARAVLDREGA